MSTARIAAAAVALAAWAGLAVQFDATFAGAGSVTATLWILLRFFTVITNLLVALSMSWLALGRRLSPFIIGGLTLAILLVGIVHALLLSGLLELSGGARLADTLLHKVTPVLMPGWWLLFAPKGGLGWRDPAWWSLYPLAYFAYALLRGAGEGRYAYPFIDVAALGLGQVLVNALLIAAAFLLAGLGLVGFDRRLGRGGKWR